MKKIYIVFLSTLLSSCLFESPSDLNVTIINNSKNKVYVGEASYECDSCGIMRDVRLYCSHGNDTSFFPQLLNAGETTIMRTKLYNIQKMNVINADSLEEYCKKGLEYNIVDKPWVKILTEKVDMGTKTCIIKIK